MADKMQKNDFTLVPINKSHYIKLNNTGNGALNYRLTIFIDIISQFTLGEVSSQDNLSDYVQSWELPLHNH
jgi:hypothetical protein